MINQLNALDPNALSGLKMQASDRSPEANKAVAKQFEALFLQQMLKGMREAMASGEGPFDSQTTRFYQGMYDQQLASVMAQNGGIGLAKYIERQLNGEASSHVPTYTLPSGTPATSPGLQSGSSSGVSGSAGAVSQGMTGATAFPGGNTGFVAQVWPQAQVAADALGVPAHFLVAQAALETGWGKSVIQGADGRSSHNLFNIKAGKNWTGRTVEARTTEYENGQPVTRVERFRAYDSYEESFRDYASLIGKSSRYTAVRGQTDATSFARALQSGGYATDPGYADKLVRVIHGKTLRQGMLASNI